MKLHDQVNRKFVKTKNIDGKRSILTPDGYKPIKKIHKTIPYIIYKIVLDNGNFLKCADNHIIIKHNDEEVFAKDSLNQDIKTQTGISKVIEVTKSDRKENMFDLELYDGYLYYSNGILSHNTASFSAYMCHYIIFNGNKTAAILGNKDKTAREILYKIKIMFENLPSWLKPGVEEWNKTSVEFDNGSRIITAATSSSSIRGMSINMLCVPDYTKVCIIVSNKIYYTTIKEAIELERLNPNSEMKILTQDGFKKVDGFISQGMTYKLLRISLSNNQVLDCTYDHKLLDINEKYKEAKSYNKNDILFNDITILNIEYIELEEMIEVFDAHNVEDTNSYLTNGVVSHNCLDECLKGDTNITLRKKNKIQEMTLEDFYEIQNKRNTDYKVLTENGFKDFEGIKQTKRDRYIKFVLSDDSIIECTFEHKIKTNNESFIEADDLTINSILFPDIHIVSKEIIYEEELFYDLIDVKEGNHYITNNVTSHNCAFVSSGIWEDFIQSVYPTVSSSKEAKIVMISCVTKDTMVFTSNGICEVSEFINDSETGAYLVHDYELVGMSQKLNQGSIMFNNGFVSTKKINIAFGDLEGSYNHKLWACKNGKYDWFKMEDLSIGDYVCVKSGMDVWGDNDDISGYTPIEFIKNKERWKDRMFEFNDNISPELSYFMGFMLGDGYFRKDLIVLTNNDDISNIFEDLNLPFSNTDGKHYSLNSKYLSGLFRYLGFDNTLKAPQKSIPLRLLKMSRINLMNLLSGLFDSDGSSSKKGTVGIALSSKKMIQQIKTILLNFGIYSVYSTYFNKPTNKTNKTTEMFKLELSSIDSDKFYEYISFHFERKQERRNNLILSERSNHHDIIPFSKQILKKAKKKEKRNHPINQNVKFIKTCGGKNLLHFTRKRMIEFKENYSDHEIFDNVDENLKWYPIKSITNSENITYDFSLNSVKNDKFCHSVLYNGIVGHQTPWGLNHFYKFWTEAVNGINGYSHFSIEWNDVPGRDEAWRDQMISEIGLERFRQEMEACFSFDTLLKIRNKNTGEVKEITVGELKQLLINIS